MILLDSNLNNEQFYDNTEIINKFIKFPVNIYSKNGIFKKLDSSIVGLWNNQNIINVTIEFKSNKLKIQLSEHEPLFINTEDLYLDKINKYIINE